MTTEISNSSDFIDSRDVIARIEELESTLESEHESELETLQQKYDEATEDADNPVSFATWLAAEHPHFNEDFDEWLKATADDDNALYQEEAEELIKLRELADEGEASPDWTYGETLIRDSYFITYAQELAEDIGAIGRDAQWPLGHIDWDAAADALKMDYFSVDFDGVTYWIRG